ncbi:replication initiator protein, partial [Streptococcus suis]
NRIYLGQFPDDTPLRNVEIAGDSSFETRGVSNLDPGGVKKTLGGSQIESRGVSGSAPNDQEISDTELSDTKLIIY